MKTKLIQLSAEEIIILIKEKSIQREKIVISSNSSFLSILALLDVSLDNELRQRLSYARSSIS